MKWLRWQAGGRVGLGLVDGQGEPRDASGLDLGDADASTRLAAERVTLDAAALQSLPGLPTGATLLAPVPRPGKVLCIGLNYSDHAAEAGMDVPEEPIVFMKASNTVVGPNDTILIPRGSEKTDWEVELGVVIGQEARYLGSPDDAIDHVAGYCISHDVSERAFQLERGGQWVKGKSCDTFNPLGPWLVSADEIDDPQALSMELDVNGQAMQRGSTRTMIFGVAFLVHYLSQFMTLQPGDVITTGTPPGVGMGMKPPKFLEPGDTVRLAIDGLGEQHATVAATP